MGLKKGTDWQKKGEQWGNNKQITLPTPPPPQHAKKKKREKNPTPTRKPNPVPLLPQKTSPSKNRQKNPPSEGWAAKGKGGWMGQKKTAIDRWMSSKTLTSSKENSMPSPLRLKKTTKNPKGTCTSWWITSLHFQNTWFAKAKKTQRTNDPYWPYFYNTSLGRAPFSLFQYCIFVVLFCPWMMVKVTNVGKQAKIVIFFFMTSLKWGYVLKTATYLATMTINHNIQPTYEQPTNIYRDQVRTLQDNKYISSLFVIG